jgi:hypothetical protein
MTATTDMDLPSIDTADLRSETHYAPPAVSVRLVGSAEWLGALHDLEPKKQHRIRSLSDEHKHWQRRSLGALSSFAMNLVQVET